jgi:hypothetical protein
MMATVGVAAPQGSRASSHTPFRSHLWRMTGGG